MTALQPHDPLDAGVAKRAQTITADDLCCLTCDYPLRGLDQSTCPECGTPFDREQMIEWLTTVQPASPWDRRRDPIGWVHTFIQVAFTPRRFARAFPPRSNRKHALQYSIVSYVLAAFVLIVGAGLLGSRGPVIVAVAVSMGASFAAFLCELMVGTVAGAYAERRESGPAIRFADRSAMAHFASGFLVLSAMYGMAGNWWGAMDPRRSVASFFITIALAISLGWWIACLCSMTYARNRSLSRTLIAFLLFAVCGAVSIGIGVYASYMLSVAFLQIAYERP